MGFIEKSLKVLLMDAEEKSILASNIAEQVIVEKKRVETERAAAATETRLCEEIKVCGSTTKGGGRGGWWYLCRFKSTFRQKLAVPARCTRCTPPLSAFLLVCPVGVVTFVLVPAAPLHPRAGGPAFPPVRCPSPFSKLPSRPGPVALGAVQHEVAHKLKETEEDLARAEPAVHAAMAALDTLNKKDLVRSALHPAPPLFLLVSALWCTPAVRGLM